MRKLVIASFFASILVITACSHKSSAAKVVLTNYTTDVQPLIQAKCSPCHLPSKGGFKANFENYEGAKKYGEDMVKRVILNPGDRGFMPFKHEKLPAQEIEIIKKWVSDGLLEK